MALTERAKKAIQQLQNNAYLFGHMVGFTKLTSLHNDWIRKMVFGDEDETLQAHRGSYKTTCNSIAFAIIMILFPLDTTMFMRKTDSDIKEVMLQVKKILRTPQIQLLCREIWDCGIDLVIDSFNSCSTNLAAASAKGTPQLFAMGTNGSLTGKHFDRIFTDDIVNVEDRTSRAERERIKLVYQELQNVKNRGGRIFNTGTPWHEEDAFTLMPNPQMFDCYSTGLMTDGDIKNIKDRMAPSLFAANYELRHIASDDVIFTDPRIDADPELVKNGEAHIDAAYGGSDGTAFTMCRKFNGKYYVFGKLWKRTHVDDVLDKILDYHKAFLGGVISCEFNADKGYLKKELRQRGERVYSYQETTNKFIKITSYVKAAWPDIYFVKGTDEEYIRQVCDFTEEADHDDAPDSLACIIRKLYTKKEYDNTANLYFL